MRVMDNQDNEKIKPQPEVQEKENKNEDIYNEEIPTISNLEFKYISTCKEADKINTENVFTENNNSFICTHCKSPPYTTNSPILHFAHDSMEPENDIFANKRRRWWR